MLADYYLSISKRAKDIIIIEDEIKDIEDIENDKEKGKEDKKQ